MRKLRVEARAKRVPYELPDLAVRVNHAGDEHLLQNFRAQARLTLAQSGAAAAAGSTRRGRGGPGHDAGGSPVADRAARAARRRRRQQGAPGLRRRRAAVLPAGAVMPVRGQATMR